MNGPAKVKLREWAAVVVVPLIFFAAWLSVSSVNQENEENRVEIACRIERQNISQLEALRAISRELGIPVTFTIPSPTAECKNQ